MLRRDMLGRGVHEDVLQFCCAELLADDYFHVVHEAMKIIASKTPCTRLPKYSREEILSKFPDAKETNAEEFTVRLQNVSDVMRLAGYIEG